MDSLYYRINGKSNLILFDNIAMEKVKSVLEIDVSNSEEKNIKEKIDLLFSSMLKAYESKDKLETIKVVAVQYKKLKKIKRSDINFAFNLCKKISSKNYNMSFPIISENINEVASLIVIGLKKLKRFNKKIKDYKSFLDEINKLKDNKIELIKQYRTYESPKDISSYQLPNEFVLLIEIFQNIKTLILPIDESNQESILTYLIIFLNYEWLFPYVFNLEIDLSCPKITKEIKEVYNIKFEEIYNECFGNSEGLKEIDYYSKIVEKMNKKKEGEELTKKEQQLFDKKIKDLLEELDREYINIIKGNNITFDLMLLFINFIKQFSFLNELIINIPDSFSKEIKDFIRLKKISPSLEEINFMDYISTINNLSYLDIKFNALESNTFDKVLYMINNNKNLKNLKINFFPEDKEFYSPSNLLKIEEANELIEDRKDKEKLNSLLPSVKNEFELRCSLFERLEKNVERFFLFLKSQEKSKLESVTLLIDYPSILTESNCYFIILKFLFNICLEINRELCKLKKFKIFLPHFNLDNKKYPFIETFFNGINLNEKNQTLVNLYLEMNIYQLPNISNLLSYSLSELFIGNLDLYTFKAFLSFYHSNTFLEKSKLKILAIGLEKNILSIEDCRNEITELIQGKNPDKLTSLSLSFNFNISTEELYELLRKANGNHIEKYSFKMKIPLGYENDKFINNKSLYYSNNKFIREIHKNLPIIMKYGFYSKDKKNIGKKLIQYLVPSNKKKFIFTNYQQA